MRKPLDRDLPTGQDTYTLLVSAFDAAGIILQLLVLLLVFGSRLSKDTCRYLNKRLLV